jgi:hypothetical protein
MPVIDDSIYNSPNPLPSGNQPQAWNKYADMMFNTVKQNTLNAGNQIPANQSMQYATKPPPPAPNQPKAPLPGKNGFTPTTAPYGMDQTNPGVQEQYWNQNQNLWTKGAFQGPGQGEQFWNQVQGNFNKSNQDLTPQFNAYYDRARNQAAGAANQQAAARGVYGSSQALNNVGNVIGDIEGQRAKASTDFMFNNAANQRANLGQYADMAFGAQGMTNNRNAMDLNALNSGYQAAGQAQNQRNNRIQGQFDNTFRQQQALLGYLGGQYDTMLGQDQDLYSQANGSAPAATAAGVAASNARRAQNSQDLANGMAVAGMAAGGPAGAKAGAAAGGALGSSGGSYAPGQYTPTSNYWSY